MALASARARSIARAAAVAAVVLAIPDAGIAAWPERPIKIVVPYAPGGASDLVGRVITGPLQQALGQTLYIENMVGANGSLGSLNVSKADPDGYTFLLTSSTVVVNPILSKSANYDPVKNFAPVVYLGGSPNVLVTRTDSDIKDFADLIARAKKDPNHFNYASSGVGSITQLSVELMKLRTGAGMTHVPFTGAGPAVQAALSGTVHLAGINISAVMPHIKAGSLRALAQTGKERWFELPDTPTLEEAGVKNAASETFQVLLAPAKTPRDIVDKMAAAVIAVLQRPDVKERLLAAGFAIGGQGPEALHDRLVSESAMWREVIAQTNLKVE
jgi:tripartite-type tricarboxylate transporter receptor subunit TctC